VPLGDTLAVTENVAAPLAAVWLAGCDEMDTVVTTNVVHVVPLFVEYCTA
jgi:hypothetical protein